MTKIGLSASVAGPQNVALGLLLPRTEAGPSPVDAAGLGGDAQTKATDGRRLTPDVDNRMISQKRKSPVRLILNFLLAALLANSIFPVRTGTAAGESATAPIVVAKAGPTPTIPVLPVVPDVPVKKKLIVRSSAYSSTRDQTDGSPSVTASGTKVHDGTIAANGFVFGTKLRIPEYFGDKVFVVEDRMHTRWGKKKIDVWMTDRAAARNWGVRTVTIEIL